MVRPTSPSGDGTSTWIWRSDRGPALPVPRALAGAGGSWAALLVLAAAAVGCAAAPSGSPRSHEPAGTGAEPGPYVLILGSAQDGGLPHPACTGPACRAALQDPARRHFVASAAVVGSNGEVFLLDATPDLPEQLALVARDRAWPPNGVRRKPVSGVFLTHGHMGHYLGLAYFGYEAIHARSVDLFATERMLGFLQQHQPWASLFTGGNLVPRPLTPGTPIDLGADVRLAAVRVPHRDELTDTVAFRIVGPSRTILYMPDIHPWSRWSNSPETVLEGVDVLVVDGTFFSPGELPDRDLIRIGHPWITETLERWSDRVRQGRLEVWFTHLNHSNPGWIPGHPARRRIEEAGFGIVEEGQRLPL